MRAKRTAISSSAPRLPGGLVRRSSRARTRRSRSDRSENIHDHLTVILRKTERISATKNASDQCVYRDMRDNGGGKRAGTNSVERARDALFETNPIFSARRGHP